MTAMEQKFQELWGKHVRKFCTACGVPVSGSQPQCGHERAAAWSDLTASERTRVRRYAIAYVKEAKGQAPKALAASL